MTQEIIPSLRIALVGYGKMGKAIESIAIEQGHRIVLKISRENQDQLNSENLKNTDVAIEFTHPLSAVKNMKACFDAGVPVVCGSTGWQDQWEEIRTYCEEKNGGLLAASNFSIGVNIFFEVNNLLARLMSTQPQYQAGITETHHTQKKDAPSGTAITLAEGIINENKNYDHWELGMPTSEHTLPITSKRIDPAPGTHQVLYESTIDSIGIVHTAHNREGFARGALMAANFLATKKGIFSMKDVLGIEGVN